MRSARDVQALSFFDHDGEDGGLMRRDVAHALRNASRMGITFHQGQGELRPDEAWESLMAGTSHSFELGLGGTAVEPASMAEVLDETKRSLRFLQMTDRYK